MPVRGLQLLLLPLACPQGPPLPPRAPPRSTTALTTPSGSTSWPVLWNADWPSQCDDPALRSLDLAALGVRTNPGNAMNGSELPALPACASPRDDPDCLVRGGRRGDHAELWRALGVSAQRPLALPRQGERLHRPVRRPAPGQPQPPSAGPRGRAGGRHRAAHTGGGIRWGGGAGL